MIAIGSNKRWFEGVAFAPFTQALGNFFAGLILAFIALPFGMAAVALVPVAIGFAKELHSHFFAKTAEPANFAWMMVGAATTMACLKLLQETL